ncbi:hypothetical protein Ae201684P_017848 [Aphanomyces euteiches]|nr:hypothetical protein Ae201684P_017848 [Aphanomyces euteiches]
MEDESLRVEVVDVNYYMAKPLPRRAIDSLIEGPCYQRAYKVPVVRIFGATPAGQKCCVHIHGIYPYFYMRCENDRAFDTGEALAELLPTVARDIESAVKNLSQQVNDKAANQRHTVSIAKLVVVKGIPFYGYHSSEKLFIKVFLYDPAMTSRIVQVVESGLVAQRVFQPYEAHIPYLLQVFADYHIEGMNFLHIYKYKFRLPLPQTQSHLSTAELWLATTSLSSFEGRAAPVLSSTMWNARTAVCSLELDVSCKNILNPAAAAATSSQCYVPSLAPLWEEEKLRRQAAGLAATPDALPSIERHTTPPQDLREHSPLSQSDFNAQMWASFETILTRVQAEQRESPTSTSSHDLPDSEMYSYSQLDDGFIPDDYKRQQVENDELLALLAKLNERIAEPEHEDIETREADDGDDEEDSLAILASQRDLEEVEENKERPWWEVDGEPPQELNVVEEEHIHPKEEQESTEWFSFTQKSSKRDVPKIWQYAVNPPSFHDMLYGGWSDATPLVHYSSDSDVPDKPVVFAGRRFFFPKQGIPHLKEWNPPSLPTINTPTPRHKVRRIRTPLRGPPTIAELQQTNLTSEAPPRVTQTQIGPTIVQSSVHTSNITILSLEIHVNTRGSLLPDPARDGVTALAYAVEANEGECTSEVGLIVVEPDSPITDGILFVANQSVNVKYVTNEKELFTSLHSLVLSWDPDFLVGFEVQQASWGYLVDRATQLTPPVNLIQTLSRLPLVPMDSRNESPPQDGAPESVPKIGTVWGMKKAAGIWMHGRHILNLWRCARSELKLNRYTFESVVANVLKRRIPLYSFQTLTQWFQSGGSVRVRTLEYLTLRTTLNLMLLDSMQLITRTSEMARLFGIDFYSVLSRGSQYRVEAVNIRVTKRLNYIMISPNRQQVAAQPALECIPLVMEPLSAFYGDPVVVLDFQSLYPSMMIAYNICYSTCFGRLKNGMDDEFEKVFGVVSNHVVDASGLIQSGKDTIITPNGALFCPKQQREGVIPLVLSEILSTRIMIKQAMKQTTNRRLSRVLDARQLALKMIANVTYGYTSASFSGRMPNSYVADSIVHCGRTTLEAAIRIVESHETWHAKVVYGDTDSLFVQLKGRTLEQALRIGNEIATEVTARNPKPVCLKLEKVYMGSFLVSKKRYVGFKFESPKDKGQLDAKGIETIRRDSCGVVQRPMRQWLRMLFTTRDLSKCKQYLQEYWTRMHNDLIPLNDFIFAKEVRLGTYTGQGPPAVLVAKKAMAKDHRAEPRYAERVAYVVVRGAPGSRLMDLVVSPDEMVSNLAYVINVEYYITKQMLPSFERLAILMGVDVRKWYLLLSRKAEKASSSRQGRLMRIDAYYTSQHCHICGVRGIHRGFCDACRSKPQQSHLALHSKEVLHERNLMDIRRVCTLCMGSSFGGLWGRKAMVCRNITCAVWNEWLPTALALEQWREDVAMYK